MFDLVLKGGDIVDGTGLAAYRGDVAIKNGKIAAEGEGEGDVEPGPGQGLLHGEDVGFLPVETQIHGQEEQDQDNEPNPKECFHPG